VDGNDWIAERGFDLSKLNWMRQQDFSDPARPVDNSTAVVGGDAASGRLDFFTRWEPNTYCPLHRHLGDTVSVVLQGEHNIEELDGSKRTRPPGHYGFTPTGECHYEFGGPQGSVVFFSMQSKDGRAFGVEDRDGNCLGVITVAEMLAGQILPL
jgi:hypothetical protein